MVVVSCLVVVGGEGKTMEEVRSKYSMWASHYNKRS
jgi:hypothetical protein